ncbi:MAG: hypothetical protein EOM77_02100 [Bacteroidia bacterium]|nr:hypothetical protein [Bacteroidia bacterium]
MKKMYKVWAIWQICEAIILMAAGVLTIIFSDNPDLYRWIFIAIGSFIVLDGTLRVLMPFFNNDPKDNSLFTGIFELTFGIVIVINSADITTILMNFIGVLLLVLAPVAITDGVLRIKKKQETLFFPILEFVAAAIFIAVGVIVIIRIENVVLIVIGAILAVLAIVEVAFTIRALLRIKERDKVEKEKVEVKAKKKTDKKEVVKVEVVDAAEAYPVDKVE